MRHAGCVLATMMKLSMDNRVRTNNAPQPACNIHARPEASRLLKSPCPPRSSAAASVSFFGNAPHALFRKFHFLLDRNGPNLSIPRRLIHGTVRSPAASVLNQNGRGTYFMHNLHNGIRAKKHTT